MLLAYLVEAGSEVVPPARLRNVLSTEPHSRHRGRRWDSWRMVLLRSSETLLPLLPIQRLAGKMCRHALKIVEALELQSQKASPQ